MANFAEIVDGKVVRIIVLSNPDLLDENGEEQEQLGIDLCNELIGPANWVQTSFNNNFRKQYGDIGFTYDDNADVFIRPSPFPSWTLDANYDWQPPTPIPDDGNQYFWDEQSMVWVLIPNLESE